MISRFSYSYSVLLYQKDFNSQDIIIGSKTFNVCEIKFHFKSLIDMRLFQNHINAGLFSSTVIGATLLFSPASYAFELEKDDHFSFAGRVEVTNANGNNYDFDFLEFTTGSGFEGLNVAVTPGKFRLFDQIRISDISSPEAGTFPAAPFEGFIREILLGDDGSATADFDIETFTFVATEEQHHILFDIVFEGLLNTSLGQTVAARGSLTSQMYLFAINEVGAQQIGSFSGTLRVTETDITHVPTPAAILPPLLTLGGIATQQRRSEEKEA